jgi:hypothetical protein
MAEVGILSWNNLCEAQLLFKWLRSRFDRGQEGALLCKPRLGQRKRQFEEAAMSNEELRDKNARLRDKINQVVEHHPDLRDLSDQVALEQGMHVEIGTPFLERVQGKLQERARAIIERRPDLKRFFDD